MVDYSRAPKCFRKHLGALKVLWYMDNLDELDSLLTSVGTNVVWKKQIGDFLLWLSPISYTAQEKVTELLTSGNGIAGLSDSKRLTLSFAIVGMNDTDFSELHKKGATFPGKNNSKVTFDRYLYNKIGEWGGQYVDDVFSIYADLIDEFQRKNLSTVKFESLNSVEEDLKEAEERVAKLQVMKAEKLASLPKEQARAVEAELSSIPEPQAPSEPKEEPKMVIGDRFE